MPIQYSYDSAGRFLSVTHGDRTLNVGYTDAAVSAPPSGLPERFSPRGIQDSLGNWTRFVRDPLGRLNHFSGPGGNTLTLAHDEDGRLTELLETFLTS